MLLDDLASEQPIAFVENMVTDVSDRQVSKLYEQMTQENPQKRNFGWREKPESERIPPRIRASLQMFASH